MQFVLIEKKPTAVGISFFFSGYFVVFFILSPPIFSFLLDPTAVLTPSLPPPSFHTHRKLQSANFTATRLTHVFQIKMEIKVGYLLFLARDGG